MALLPTTLPSDRAETQSGATRQRVAHVRDQVAKGSVVGGRYEIGEFVAEGAFGAVYRANDLDVPGHVVAIKLMHRSPASDEERTRCLREAQLIAAVSHPSVVSFKDHGWHRGRFYIVMPWYEGETLAQRIVRTGEGLSRREAARIFRQLADALAAMHARGIRHQDVKPENILLARFGEGSDAFPVLLDLGVGAWGSEMLPAFTPAYVAPEMARAHLDVCEGHDPIPVDGKTDVFALSLTLFDALAPGARDLAGCTGRVTALRARATQGADLPWVEALTDIQGPLARWLAVDPAERPSARELSSELAILTRAEERSAERRRLLRRITPVLAVVGSVVAILAVQLRTERVRSHVKDQRIENQAAQIEEVRTQLTALDEQRRAQERELVGLLRKNADLASRLQREHARRATLESSVTEEQKTIQSLQRDLM